MDDKIWSDYRRLVDHAQSLEQVKKEWIMYTHLYIHMYIYTYVHTYVHIYIHMFIQMYIQLTIDKWALHNYTKYSYL
jgi:hypothetical protein